MSKKQKVITLPYIQFMDGNNILYSQNADVVVEFLYVDAANLMILSYKINKNNH